jgi:hypothetical protein
MLSISLQPCRAHAHSTIVTNLESFPQRRRRRRPACLTDQTALARQYCTIPTEQSSCAIQPMASIAVACWPQTYVPDLRTHGGEAESSFAAAKQQAEGDGRGGLAQA